MTFTYADNYRPRAVDNSNVYLGILKFESTVGPYNLYRLLPGDKKVVIFDDQLSSFSAYTQFVPLFE